MPPVRRSLDRWYPSHAGLSSNRLPRVQLYSRSLGHRPTRQAARQCISNRRLLSTGAMTIAVMIVPSILHSLFIVSTHQLLIFGPPSLELVEWYRGSSGIIGICGNITDNKTSYAYPRSVADFYAIRDGTAGSDQDVISYFGIARYRATEAHPNAATQLDIVADSNPII